MLAFRLKTVRFVSLMLALAALVGMQSCHSDNSSAAPVTVDDEGNMQPVRDTMPRIMQSKLAHAHAVLEGVAMANFEQIQINATALMEISQHADWMVHDTASYHGLSENFWKATQSLHEDAGRRDIAAVTHSYNAMVASCVACHRYLQAEKPTLQMPGRVSFAKSASPFLMK